MLPVHINDTVKQLGTKGEVFVGKMLIARGYVLYKSNIRGWGFEIDLLVYRLIPHNNVLEIRAVEVKTRKSSRVPTLSELNIDKKLSRYKYLMFTIGQEIYSVLNKHQDVTKTAISPFFKYHLDLAIVGVHDSSLETTKSLYLQKYIQNVNLLI